MCVHTVVRLGQTVVVGVESGNGTVGGILFPLESLNFGEGNLGSMKILLGRLEGSLQLSNHTLCWVSARFYRSAVNRRAPHDKKGDDCKCGGDGTNGLFICSKITPGQRKMPKSTHAIRQGTRQGYAPTNQFHRFQGQQIQQDRLW